VIGGLQNPKGYDEMMDVLVNGMISGSIYALVALGFTLTYGTVRFFNFAHGAVYTLGAYTAWCLIFHCGLPVAGSFFLPA